MHRKRVGVGPETETQGLEESTHGYRYPDADTHARRGTCTDTQSHAHTQWISAQTTGAEDSSENPVSRSHSGQSQEEIRGAGGAEGGGKTQLTRSELRLGLKH